MDYFGILLSQKQIAFRIIKRGYMYLENEGIIGWEGIEPALLAAIATNKSVLFVGDHGINKTEGAAIIAKLVLGPGTHFQKYDVPLVNQDDLLGFPNPKALQDGRMEFIPTKDGHGPINKSEACVLSGE